MPVIGETGTGSRLQLSKSLKNDAKGFIKTTAEILAIAASMTQNAPYLGMISSALTEFLKIKNEVDAYKSEWKQVMGIAHQIKVIVDDVRDRCEAVQTGAAALPDTLIKPFVELEKCVAKVLEVYTASRAESIRYGNRLRVYLGRGELLEEVKRCRVDMQAALDLFNLRLNIDQWFEMPAIKTILIEILNELQNKRPARNQVVAKCTMNEEKDAKTAKRRSETKAAEEPDMNATAELPKEDSKSLAALKKAGKPKKVRNVDAAEQTEKDVALRKKAKKEKAQSSTPMTVPAIDTADVAPQKGKKAKRDAPAPEVAVAPSADGASTKKKKKKKGKSSAPATANDKGAAAPEKRIIKPKRADIALLPDTAADVPATKSGPTPEKLKRKAEAAAVTADIVSPDAPKRRKVDKPARKARRSKD